MSDFNGVCLKADSL